VGEAIQKIISKYFEIASIEDQFTDRQTLSQWQSQTSAKESKDCDYR